MYPAPRAASEAALPLHPTLEARRSPHHRRGGGTRPPLRASPHSRSEGRLKYEYRGEGWCVPRACACARACAWAARACPRQVESRPTTPGQPALAATRRGALRLTAVLGGLPTVALGVPAPAPRGAGRRAKVPSRSLAAAHAPAPHYPPEGAPARSGLLPGPGRRALGGSLPWRGCDGALVPAWTRRLSPPPSTPGGVMMLLVVATDDPADPAAAPPAAAAGAPRLPSLAAAAMISQLAHATGKCFVGTTD